MKFKRVTTIKAKDPMRLNLMMKILKKFQGNGDLIETDYMNNTIIVTTIQAKPAKDGGVFVSLLKVLGLTVTVKDELLEY